MNDGAWQIFAARTDDPQSAPGQWSVATGSGWAVGGTPAPLTPDASDIVGAMPAHPESFVTKKGGAIGEVVTVSQVGAECGCLAAQWQVAESPSTDSRWTYNPQFYPTSADSVAIVINANSTTPGEHRREMFSPMGIADVAAHPTAAA